MSAPLGEIVSKLLQPVFVLRRRRLMRKQLYGEISANYQNLVVRIAVCQSLAGIGKGAPLRFSEGLDISFHAWNFYSDDSHRHELFKLKEAPAISRIYEKFSNIGNEALPGYALTRAKEAAAEVDERILDQSLNRTLYKNVSTPEAWRTMERLIAGKRESWRKSLNLF